MSDERQNHSTIVYSRDKLGEKDIQDGNAMHGDTSAISSLGKLLARPEPSGEQQVRPSLVFPHFVNRTTLSFHWPMGPLDPGSLDHSHFDRRETSRAYAILVHFFPTRLSLFDSSYNDVTSNA